ncbi:dipeptide/oligopeptide/nickel ABC transporter permease/ATP-binding protein [Streptomyces sp. H10-C2]|uniref:dipeptide/oligopeptide/nickel ABC transporter permease/ATP-binding protein n=1 Tax=unclassified Streptomyces TaxID=2593676 RepID=UPI0024BBD733|nr:MULTISPECIES: dipeptide/oligopeptide/nickel ABC transporter permease/ATP-binding protein [unclassified Streptomyces]MDJ0345860.1 dipeptide/oligopeptide/nickel ABC transporter permease/ATP-binding protein [Streptomyces sp. PH10-H1]MDJ0371174.1 dipeptide/oligopeptide/nickel ABC transporter permease/ATP-binding protein [Streptomyces sp. H10-C2]
MKQLTTAAAGKAAHPPGLVRRILRRPAGAVSIGWLVLLIAATAGAALICPHGPLDQDLAHVLGGPSADHLLGTDNLGRDLLSRLLFGGRSTLLATGEALVVFLLIGVTLGLASGFLGGWVDWLITRTADLLFALPGIIIVLVVLSVFPGNLHAAMITFGVLGSPGMIRVLRSQTLGIREELYVAAARVAGLTPGRILRRHVLPRMTSMVIVQAALFAAVVVIIQSGLGFLGLGAQPPNPSWGGLVADASQAIDRAPWMLVPAGVPLVLTVMALGLLGDAIRDASVEGWSVSKLAAPAAALLRASAAPTAPTAPIAPTALADRPDTTDTAVPSWETTAADPGALLSVRNLSIEIGGTLVVQGVSFDVHAGETLGVIGESGCGKSVTSLGILGLIPGGGRITAGQVLFDGVDLAGPSAALALAHVRGSGIAYVSQEPMVALDPTFAVGHQLAEAVRRHRRCDRREARSRVADLLQMVNIPDPATVARRYPHQLSGGMAQRVAIALALAGGPKLLIADEPTTALDVTVQAEILTLLRTLQAETGMAVLIVTHDWGVVADLCHRSVVMYAGQIVEQAEVEEMFIRPLHPYTAVLLAANPHLAGDGGPLPTIPGTVPAPRDWPHGCRFAARCTLATDACTDQPVVLTEPAPDRLTRCIHSQQLLVEGTRS